MKSKSMTASSTAFSSIIAVPQIAASFSPLFACDCWIRTGYGFWSLKPSGSPLVSSVSCSVKLPLSTSSSMRSRAPSRKWWSHFVQTL